MVTLDYPQRILLAGCAMLEAIREAGIELGVEERREFNRRISNWVNRAQVSQNRVECVEIH